MDRPIHQKMGITKEDSVLVVNGPKDTVGSIALPSRPDTKRTNREQHDHIILFTQNQLELDREFLFYSQQVPSNGKLWVAWPKGGRLGTDLNIKEVIRIGYEHGLVESTNLRFDDTWTALKFTHPKPGKKYNNSYGTLKLANDQE